MRETETDTQSIMGRGQGLEGWSSCWEEKADILEKPRQLSVLVPKGQEGPITQISLSETSLAGFALNGRGKLGSQTLALTPPNPVWVMVPWHSLSRRPGDACFWSVEGLKNFGAGTLTLKACRERAKVPTPSHGEGIGANQSHPQKTRVRRPVTGGSDLPCSQVVLAEILQEQPKNHQAPFITQSTPNPSLPIWKAGVGGEKLEPGRLESRPESWSQG